MAADVAPLDVCRRGDRAAFAEIYRRYRPDVIRLCAKLCGTARAEDLAQEVFLRVFTRIGTFRPGNPFWPWLRRIARNVCVDELRRGGPVRVISLVDEHDRGEAHESVELRAALAAAMAGIPERDRRYLWLREVEDRSYEEIASAHATTVDAVRNVAWRARVHLRALLADVRALLPLAGLLDAVRGAARRARARVEAALARLGNASLPIAVEQAGAVLIALVMFATPWQPERPRDETLRVAAQAPAAPPDAVAAGRVAGADRGARTPREAPPGPVTVEADWAPGGATPRKTKMRIEVRGPDGKRIFWTEIDRECERGWQPAPIPQESPVRAWC